MGPLLMKSSQSNFNLRSPSSYMARSYPIATVTKHHLFTYVSKEFFYMHYFCPSFGPKFSECKRLAIQSLLFQRQLSRKWYLCLLGIKMMLIKAYFICSLENFQKFLCRYFLVKLEVLCLLFMKVFPDSKFCKCQKNI